MQLIDRYVPRHTREEVVEMSIRYEERITSLLLAIHQYSERCHSLQVHLSELEDEYAKRTMINVPFGKLTAESELSFQHMAPSYRIIWRPEAYGAAITLPHEPYNREEFPRLFDATMKRFERMFAEEAVKQLRSQYAELYMASSPK